MDDIIALAYVLRQPSLDVRAITVSGTGLVHCAPGLRVARSIANAMDAPSVRIGCGRESAGDLGHPFPAPWRRGADAGYGIDFPLVRVGELGETTPAPALIAEVAGSETPPLTILSLGPMTNIADALAVDGVAPNIERILAMAGAIDIDGNVFTDDGSPLPAEWNVYADPASAQVVLSSDVPTTLVPLDATQYVPVKDELVAELANSHEAAGADIANELFARFGVHPGDFLWDPLAAVALIDPTVLTLEPMRLAVDVSAADASGSLVRSSSAPSIDVATHADYDRFAARLLDGLRLGAQRSNPFTIVGTLKVEFDGTVCSSDPADAMSPGNWTFTAASTATDPSLLAIVLLHDGWTWQDLAHYVDVAQNPGDAPPFVDVTGTLSLDEPGEASTTLEFEPGTYAAACVALRDAGVATYLTGGSLEVDAR